MREILFRAKRTINGEWIEGYLVKLGKESFSDPERYGICKKAIPLGGSGVCYNLKIDEIIPETVGQFTGLTDKNGTKIFTGDIVKFFNMVGEVCFEKGCFGIGVKDLINLEKLEEQILPTTGCDNESYFLYNDLFVSFWELMWNYNAEENCNVCEIIGNIYDNPELLEVAK